ncbi:hypothetical protein ACW9HQ_52285, partial [Nocardia gipuzkoensis]
GAAVLAGAGSVWVLMYQTGHGVAPWVASEVFQPHLMVFYVLIIPALYAIARWWARLRRPESFTARAVAHGADRSLGVFLLHPLVLQLFAPATPRLTTAFGPVWGIVALYGLVLAAALAGTEVLRRIPGSRSLTGRPMLHTVSPISVRHDAQRTLAVPVRSRVTPFT